MSDLLQIKQENQLQPFNLKVIVKQNVNFVIYSILNVLLMGKNQHLVQHIVYGNWLNIAVNERENEYESEDKEAEKRQNMNMN